MVAVDIDPDAAPAGATDAYLRLHLLSHRLVRPRSINLDGIFGVLANVAWTTHGPCPVDGFEDTPFEADRDNWGFSRTPGSAWAATARCRCSASTSSRG